MASTTLVSFSSNPGTPAAVKASSSTPRTPASNIGGSKMTTETPSPGNWKHPRMAEIVRRRKASTFDSANVLRITYNATAFLASYIAFPILKSYLPIILSLLYHSTSFLGAYQVFPVHILRALFIYNVYRACQPMWKEPDNLSDIPLTPSQRRLIGLDPGSGKPNTPKTDYVTPPRYKRSTPRSQSPVWSQGRRASGSGSQRGALIGADGYSPGGSPSWGQTNRWETTRSSRTDKPDARRTSSFGLESLGVESASPARDQLRDSSGIWVPSTPTPSSRGTGASVGLNSKWLYERGRSSSGSRRSFGGL